MVGQSWLGPGTTFARGKGSHYWLSQRQQMRSGLKLWHARNIPMSDQLTLGAFFSHSCFSTSPLWGEGADSGRGQITYWEEWNQVRLDPQGFFSSTWGSVPSFNKAVLVRVQENFWLTPGSGFIPSVSSSGSHQGNDCHYTLGRDLTHAHFRSGSPTKTLGHTETVKGHTKYKETLDSSKINIDRCFS